MTPTRVDFSVDLNGAHSNVETNDLLWNLLLMVVPILSMVALGIIFLLVVLVIMVKESKKFGLRYLLTQWRLFVFISFYVYIYSFVFAFQIQLLVQVKSQYDDYVTYFDCLFVQTAQVVRGDYTTLIGCSLHQKVSYPLWFIVVFNASVQGIFVFGIFGTSKNVFKIWWVLIKTRRFPRATSNATLGSGGVPMKKIQGTKATDKTLSVGSKDLTSEGTPTNEDDRTDTSSSGGSDNEDSSSDATSSAKPGSDTSDGEEEDMYKEDLKDGAKDGDKGVSDLWKGNK